MKLKDYLIAVDLDGTLLSKGTIRDKKSFRLLKKLAKDNYVIIATGRPLRGSIFYYDLLKLKTPIINYNGALVQNPHDKNFPKSAITINKEDLFQFIEDNQEDIITIFSEVEDDIYLWKENKYSEKYMHVNGGNLFIGSLADNLKVDPNGAIVFSKSGSSERLNQHVNKNYGDRMFLRCWNNDEIVISELYNTKTSKAFALKKIIEYYNINPKKTIAIGDGHNDIEMLQTVEYGVAMGNAHHDLVGVSKYQTKTNKKHGVYYFLKHFEKLTKSNIIQKNTD